MRLIVEYIGQVEHQCLGRDITHGGEIEIEAEAPGPAQVQLTDSGSAFERQGSSSPSSYRMRST
jgi:hypothetical protein